MAGEEIVSTMVVVMSASLLWAGRIAWLGENAL